MIEGNITSAWDKNPQYVISCPQQQNPTNALRVLMHFDDDAGSSVGNDKMTKCGFLVYGTNQDQHKEPSYQTSVAGYGAIEPTAIILRKEDPSTAAAEAPEGQKKQEIKPFHCILPYVKGDAKGRFKIVLFSQEPLVHKELEAWKFKIQKPGQWAEGSAGGCKQFQDTWTTNPRFKIKLPSGRDKFTMCIMLSQAKSGIDLIPFQVQPYQFFIGFYVLEEMDIVFENKNWKNALDIWDIVTLDTRKESEFLIVPTTFKQNQLTNFTVTVFSDEEVQFL
jgi:hypothetical protein